MSEIAAARPAPLHGHTAAHRRTPPHTAAHRRILAPRPPCASSQSSPSLPLSLPPSPSGGGGLTPEEYARQMARELRLPPDLQARQRHRANQSYASPDPRPSPAAPPLRSLAVPTRPPIGRLLHPPAASRPPQAAAALALRRETQGLLRPAAGLSEPLVPLHEPSVRRIGGAGAGTAAESDPPVSLGRRAPRGAWRGCSQRALAVNRSGRRGRRCCGASRCSPPAPSEA